jgi:hypothetical protein
LDNTWYYIVSATIAFVGVIVTLILNFMVFNRRLLRERDYQIDKKFYESVIVENIKVLFKFTKKLDTKVQAQVLVIEKIVGPEREKNVQAFCNVIESDFAEAYTNLSNIFIFHSFELHRKFRAYNSEFYDQILTAITGPMLKNKMIEFNYEYEKWKFNYLVVLRDLIKSNQPSIEVSFWQDINIFSSNKSKKKNLTG